MYHALSYFACAKSLIILVPAVMDSFSPVDKLASITTSEVKPTVDLASSIVDSLKEIDTPAKLRFPLPSVCKKFPVPPSALGSLSPLITTFPEPLASNSRLLLEVFVDIVFPEKVILFGRTSVV